MQHAILDPIERAAPTLAEPVAAACPAKARSVADRAERERILNVLTRCGGNRTWAADILGMKPLALREKLVGYRREAEMRETAIAWREANLHTQMLTAEPALRPTYMPSVTYVS